MDNIAGRLTRIVLTKLEAPGFAIREASVSQIHVTPEMLLRRWFDLPREYCVISGRSKQASSELNCLFHLIMNISTRP